MVIWFIRALFIVMVCSLLLMGFKEGGVFNFQDIEKFELHKTLAYVGCLLVVVIGLAVDLLVKRKSLAGLAGIFFGLAVGLMIGLGFNRVVEFAYQAYNIGENSDLYVAKDGIKLLINILCCYLAIVFIMQTKDDFRFIIPYVEFSKQAKGTRPLILDTSVIIDGRIADIAKTNILNNQMIVPRFILNELQNVADSADRLRRNRGRRGLDILNKMQSDSEIDIVIKDIELSERERAEPVDHQLVSACQKLTGRVVTNDYNLNKVAGLRGVEVININDLANAIKPVVLPGEVLRVNIAKTGDQPGQGVGYLADGTMVVVDQARGHIGRDIDAVITSVLQTSAGRLIFGKLEGADDQQRPNQQQRNNRQPRGRN